MRQFIVFFIFSATVVLLYGCAKEAAPTGGPKDFDPPVVVETKPPNYSTNFSENKVKIYFNEFVKLKNLREELLISPPFKEIPKMVMKGKKLVISMPDSLPEERTVNFSFYNAIVDVNEENVLKNYQYVFSTASEIDTSFIDGRLTDAETGQPLKNELIYVYESFEDSVVSKRLPDYLARTNEQGIFVVNNLGEGPYKIFALKDRNRNNLYDQPTEATAFLNDTIVPAIEWTTMQDTIRLIDSIIVAEADTIYRDSVYEQNVQVSQLKPFQLRLFTRDYHKHYLTYSGRPKMGLLALSFNRSIADFEYDIQIVSPSPTRENWYLEEKVTNDSVLLWLNDSALFYADSIYAAVTFPYTDSVGNVIDKTDSVYLNYKFDELKKTDTLIAIGNDLRKNTLDVDSTLTLTFSEPLKQIDSSKIQFFINPDTAFEPYNFQLKPTEDLRRYDILFKQDLYGKYKLILDSAAVVGYFGNVNDSTVIKFRYYEMADYGNLVLNVDTIPKNAIFLLFNKEGELFAKKQDVERIPVEFNQLPPGDYNVRMLIDANDNGKWDTGDYYQNQFPELVIAFPSKLIVKANWDTEQTWELSKALQLYE